jgi:hypothetical protein
MTRPPLLAFALVAVTLVAAGCGGGGSGSSGSSGGSGSTSGTTTSGGGSGNVDTTSNAYKGGFETCSGGTVAEIADLYGVPQKTPDAVAEVIAEQLAGGSGEQGSVKQGCLDAFAKKS